MIYFHFSFISRVSLSSTYDELRPRKSRLIQLEMRSSCSWAIDTWNTLSRYLIGREIWSLHSSIKRFIEIPLKPERPARSNNRIGANCRKNESSGVIYKTVPISIKCMIRCIFEVVIQFFAVQISPFPKWNKKENCQIIKILSSFSCNCLCNSIVVK